MTSFLSWLLGCSSFDSNSLKPNSSWQLPESSDTVGISPDGELLAVSVEPRGSKIIDGIKYGGRTKLELRNTNDGSLIKTLDAFAVSSVAISQDNSLIATGSYYGYITIYNLETGKVLHSINVPKENPQLCINSIQNVPCRVTNIAFSPNNQNLVSYLANQGTYVWQVNEGKQLYRLNALVSQISLKGIASQISPDSKFFAHDAKILRLSDGEVVRQLKQKGTSKFSPDGKSIAIAVYEYNDRNLFLYDLEENANLQKLAISKNSLYDWKFSLNGKHLVAVAHTEQRSIGGSIHVGDNLSRKVIQYASSEIAIYQIDNLSSSRKTHAYSKRGDGM